MTVVAIMAGLLPIMWSTGTGSEIMQRIAVPMIGGMVSSTLLTLIVIPAIFGLVRGFGLPPSDNGSLQPPTFRLRPKELGAVKAITYCHDTYRVTTADGKTRAFWERNLILKTDSSQEGPERGAPAIMPTGMMGDRASAIFSSPEEIGKFIESKC
jgi:hypothetical protein